MTIKERVKGLSGEDKRRVQIEIGKDMVRMFKSNMTNEEIAKETGLSESSIRSVRSHYEENNKK